MSHATTPPPSGDYYSSEREEVAKLVPQAARYVVDVGCGAGGLGRLLKRQRPGIEVRGIEIVPDQAELARQVLDDVHVGSAEGPLPTHWPRPDCIVFADVLEHLVDPWTALRHYRDWLAEGGQIVVSLPNVAHWSILRGLVGGRWEYRDAGLLDRTHLRFFTTQSAIALVEGAGFRVRELYRVFDGNPRMSRHARRVTKISGRRGLRDIVLDSLTFQVLMVAS